VGVWERFQIAEERTYDEASSLISVYRDADGFSDGARLRRDLRSYVEYTVRVGWPALVNGEPRPEAHLAEVLSRDVHTTPVHDARQAQLYGHMIERTSESLRDRDARVAEDSTGLNGVMWCVVFAGGFITIAFTSLFGFRQTVMQTAMIGTLALLIGLVIFLTMSLDFPFRGAIRVGPEAFERALYVFDRVDAADPVSVHMR
jgi:hypothetical protein